MPSQLDPFTQVHNAIWDALKASANFNAQVRVGDRIDVTTDGQQRKQVHRSGVPADMPEFDLEQGPFSQAMVNSKAGRITQVYRAYVSSGSQKIIKINIVKYEAFRALVAAGDNLGVPHLVRDWNITNGNDTYDKSGPDRREGYNAIFSITVEMYIDRATLLQTSS